VKEKATPKTSSFAMKYSSTTFIAVAALVVGSTISSLMFVSFHYKSNILRQQHNEKLLYHFGPPNVSYSSLKHSSPPLTAAKISEVSRPIESVNPSPMTNATEHDKRRTDQGCLSRFNSEAWLENRRMGNQNSEDSRIIDNEYVASSILKTRSLFSDHESNSHDILQRTLCAESSRFINTKFSSFGEPRTNELLHDDVGDGVFATADDTTKNQTIHQLSLRLLYLSIHVHQHRHAIKEAEHRLEKPEECEREMVSRNIGTYDFECPDARFLVVPMKHGGLGAQARFPSRAVGSLVVPTERQAMLLSPGFAVRSHP